jgi:hypothetical protein
MKRETINIKFEWEGSFSLKDIGLEFETKKYSLKNAKLNNKNRDFGLYQIYGFHPIYGDNVLLYIGKATKQTFAKRISQEAWEHNQDFKNIRIYVGRLLINENISFGSFKALIDRAEKMLIYSHSSAMNSSNILNISKDKAKLKEFENIRVFNYDSYRSLMSEVSGEYWIREFEYIGTFNKN